MKDNPTQVRRDWRLPDALWGRIAPVLPPRKPHPLGCHRPRVDDRQAAELCGVSAFGMCLYSVQTIWPTEIGS